MKIYRKTSKFFKKPYYNYIISSQIIEQDPPIFNNSQIQLSLFASERNLIVEKNSADDNPQPLNSKNISEVDADTPRSYEERNIDPDILQSEV